MKKLSKKILSKKILRNIKLLGVVVLLLASSLLASCLLGKAGRGAAPGSAFAGQAAGAPAGEYSAPDTFQVPIDSYVFRTHDRALWIGSLEVTASGDDIYFKNVYVANENDAVWTQLSFPAVGNNIGNWLIGNGRILIPFSNYFKEGRNAVLVYGCSEDNYGWLCHDNKWMFKIITVVVSEPLICVDSNDCPTSQPYCGKDGFCRQLPLDPNQPSAFP